MCVCLHTLPHHNSQRRHSCWKSHWHRSDGYHFPCSTTVLTEASLTQDFLMAVSETNFRYNYSQWQTKEMFLKVRAVLDFQFLVLERRHLPLAHGHYCGWILRQGSFIPRHGGGPGFSVSPDLWERLRRQKQNWKRCSRVTRLQGETQAGVWVTNHILSESLWLLSRPAEVHPSIAVPPACSGSIT